MAFSKVKVGGLADDSVTAANVDDDGTGYTVGNLSNSGTLQQTGQVTIGTGSGSGGSFTLPTSRGANDKYVLQINTTSGAATWVESLVAPEISSHNFDVSGSTDDGGINAYEAPYELTGTTNATTTISAINTTNLLVGQYISGAGIPANTTISAIPSPGSSGSITISAAVTVAGTQTSVALKIQKTPGEKNGGKVILTGINFGVNVADISVAITTSVGGVIANASYLTGLSATSITAEWTGTEGTYSTDLTSSYSGKLYFKMTKSGLASSVYDSDTTLTTDGSFTALSTSSQTGGDRSVAPGATTLGTYGSGRIAGGGQDANTQYLINFDRGGGTDFEDSSNTGGDGHKVTATVASIKASPFGDGKSAMFFDGTDDKLSMSGHADFQFQTADFTVEQWVYFDTVGADQGIWAHTGEATNASPELALYFEESTDRITLRKHNGTDSGNSKNFQCSWSPVAKQWYHIALVRYSNQLYIYVDGAALPQVTNSSGVPFENGNVSATNTLPNMATNKNFLIGCDQDDGRHFQGYMDSFRIVSSAVYNSYFNIPTSRLTAITNTKLLINSNQDHTAKSGITGQFFPLDIEGDGVYQRTESTARNSVAASNWDNSAWYFDGGSSGALFDSNGGADNNYADVCPTSTSEMTIEFWIKSDSTSSTQMYLIDVGSTGWNLRYTPSSNAWVLFSNAFDGNGQMALGTHDVADNAWHHVALVKYVDGSNKNRVKFYIDGVLKTTSSNNDSDSNAVWPTNTAFRIGGDGGFYDGYIDDLRITKGLVVYTGAFTPPTTKLTTTWSASSGIAANSDASKVAFLLKSVDGNSGTGGFIDSATTGHTITPTGSGHTITHGGIDTALAWPASGKRFGSSGYFSGANTSRLDLTVPGSNWANDWSWECFFNIQAGNNHNSDQKILFALSHGSGKANFGVSTANKLALWWDHDWSSPWQINGDSGGAGSATLSNHTWYHVLFKKTSGQLAWYIDGSSSADFTAGSLGSAANMNSSLTTMRIGSWESSGQGFFKGYMDGVRFSTTAITPSLPTRAYGAFGQKTPDAGTITLTATGAGDYTWSEVTGGTALPGSLAVGSTTHSGSGDSRTHTATITGSFSEDTTSTFTNGAKSDVSTNNILLKAQNDADSTKAITLGSSGGYDGIGITQKSTENPVLFNGRRYIGDNDANSKILGYGFQPDLVWAKRRDATKEHMLVDSVRGIGRFLESDTDDTENVNAAAVKGFEKDGFTPGNSSISNTDGGKYVAWAWKAGGPIGSGSAPTGPGLYKLNGESTERTATTYPVTGSGYAHGKSSGAGDHTTYEASYNVDVGFAIIKTTSKGDGTSGNTFPTFIGDPDVIFAKQLDSDAHWFVHHKSMSLTSGMRSVIYLNLNEAQDATTGSTNGFGTDANIGANSGKTWDLGSNNATNNNGTNNRYVYYLWKAVTGVSAFGEYTGTANVTTNFRPRLLIVKRKSGGTGNWFMFDGFREGTDAKSTYILTDTDGAENSTSNATATFSNTGFTTGSHDGTGASGSSYLYMAYA